MKKIVLALLVIVFTSTNLCSYASEFRLLIGIEGDPQQSYNIDFICTNLKDWTYDDRWIILYSFKKKYIINNEKLFFYHYPFLWTWWQYTGEWIDKKYDAIIKKNIFFANDLEQQPVQINSFIKKNNEVYFIANISPHNDGAEFSASLAYIELFKYRCDDKTFKKLYTIPQTRADKKIINFWPNRAKVLNIIGNEIYYAIRSGFISEKDLTDIEVYKIGVLKPTKHKKISYETYKFTPSIKKQLLKIKSLPSPIYSLKDLINPNGYSIDSIFMIGENIIITYNVDDTKNEYLYKLNFFFSIAENTIYSVTVTK